MLLSHYDVSRAKLPGELIPIDLRLMLTGCRIGPRDCESLFGSDCLRWSILSFMLVCGIVLGRHSIISPTAATVFLERVDTFGFPSRKSPASWLKIVFSRSRGPVLTTSVLGWTE